MGEKVGDGGGEITILVFSCTAIPIKKLPKMQEALPIPVLD